MNNITGLPVSTIFIPSNQFRLVVVRAARKENFTGEVMLLFSSPDKKEETIWLFWILCDYVYLKKQNTFNYVCEYLEHIITTQQANSVWVCWNANGLLLVQPIILLWNGNEKWKICFPSLGITSAPFSLYFIRLLIAVGVLKAYY